MKNHVYNFVRCPKHALMEATPVKLVATLPTSVDLRSTGKLPSIYDQEDLGSCTANALCAAYHYMDDSWAGSRLYLYYNERKHDNDIPDDAGSTITESVKAAEQYGLCNETTWPYDISKFTICPTKQCYTEGEEHKVCKAHKLQQDLNSLKHCLAGGSPFIFGIDIYDSFESDEVSKTGIVPMPASGENNLGGHAVCCIGYDDSKKAFLVRNSWGVSWGDEGHFWLPYDFVDSKVYSSDFWYLIEVEKN